MTCERYPFSDDWIGVVTRWSTIGKRSPHPCTSSLRWPSYRNVSFGRLGMSIAIVGVCCKLFWIGHLFDRTAVSTAHDPTASNR
jgi:hypothetical protein